ncbi:hypothetical protein Q9L58_000429 [Maublancomyces gigas]|uniref:Glutaredoxin domain-containing protein n=1 Tax=Discina gigas TaxID=1032678 RepID=A0ABR3GWY5_9PEZI
MPSSRRVKLLAVAAITLIFIIIYYNSDSSIPSQSRYLDDLKAASERERLIKLQTESLVPPPDHAQDLTDTAGVTERLKEAEDAAKKAAGEKAGPKPDSPSKMQEAMKNRNSGKKESVAAGPETDPVEYDALSDIAQILKRSPIVIFSKSYCPFSLRAKDLLLKQYKITPSPFVVELDKYEHGVELQAALAKQTGRRTVPNIMISGKSLGGSDEMAALEVEGKLVERIQKMGGKRIMEILKLKV